jgi:hypothetical protein
MVNALCSMVKTRAAFRALMPVASAPPALDITVAVPTFAAASVWPVPPR